MAITKLDWLSRYAEVIPVCVEYERKGNKIQIAPNAEYKLQQSKPIYNELPSWDEDVSEVRRFEDLPKNAQKFVEFVEEQTNTPVTMIGVGPRRDQVIVRN
jgi:adenylosuccinate synthase